MPRKRHVGEAMTPARQAYYESNEALRRLSAWYSNEKEESFINFVFDNLCLPSDGLVVEIGGGAGLHGRILAQRFSTRYLFTDLSKNFVDSARKSGLPAAQMDGLAMTLDEGSAACAVLVGPSTLLHEQETRQRQFRECARILRPDGVGIFVTPRWDREYHLCDHDDAEFLRKLGFSITWLNWGIIPGRLWNSRNKHFFNVIERIVSKANLSVRVVLLARRSTRT
jgi:SAM-dependent methyltransferase